MRRLRLQILDALDALRLQLCPQAAAVHRTASDGAGSLLPPAEASNNVRLLREDCAKLKEELHSGKSNADSLETLWQKELDFERQRSAELERRLAAERATVAVLLDKHRELTPAGRPVNTDSNRKDVSPQPTARTARSAIASTVQRALKELAAAREELAVGC